jgi:hypothetical protein
MMGFADGRNGATTANPGVAAQFASVDLDVDGRDVGGLNLALRPSLSMSGRVAFRGSGSPPANLTTIRVSMSSSSAADGTVVFGLTGGAARTIAASVGADGAFQIVGIVPGWYTVSTNSPAGWRLRSVVANGRDLLDEPLQVDTGSMDITDAVVTFIDARSEVAGTLGTASGQPASEFTVLVFPVERTYWRAGARRIRTARPGSDGAFNIMDLPGGEYLLAALTDVDPSDLRDARFLEQIVGAAVKITVVDGQTTRQELRIAR